MTKLSDTQRVILSKAAQHDALLAEPPARLPAAARQSVLRSLTAKGLLEEVLAPREHAALGWRQDEEGAWIALRITAAGLTAMGFDTASFPQAVDNNEIQSTPAVPTCIALLSATLSTGPQGDSLAAFPAAPPMTSAAAPGGLQRPPQSPRGGIGGATALRTAATSLLTAWDAPDRPGLDAAVAALREVLSTCARRPPRDPATPRQPRTGTKQEAVLAMLRRDEGTIITEIVEATGWQPHTVRGFLAGLKRRGITVEVLERVRQVGPNKQGAQGSYSIYRIAAAGGPAATLVEAG